MAEPIQQLGTNTELDEDANGVTILRNTATGTEIRLDDFVDIVGGFGEDGNPISGTSYFEAISTDQVNAGTNPTNRPLISNDSQTVYVDPVSGSDNADGSEINPVATVAEALSRCPIYLRHKYIIDLATSPSLPVSYNEDVLVNTVIGTGQATQEGGAAQAGPVTNLEIIGDQANPSNVTINSVMVGNCSGVSVPRLQGATINGTTPYDDEDVAVAFYGTGEGSLFDIEFGSNSVNGILSYGSKLDVRRADVSNTDAGITAKRGARVQARDISGTASSAVYDSREYSEITFFDNTATAPQLTKSRRGAEIYDQDNNRWQKNAERQYNMPLKRTVKDADGSTVFDWSPTTISNPPDWYRIIYDIEFNGSGTFDVRVNGLSQNDYVKVDGGGSRTTGADSWNLGGAGNGERAMGVINISGGNAPSGGAVEQGISHNGHLSAGTGILEYGELSQKLGDITDIRLFTDANALGKADLYGYYFGGPNLA
jgi:hypothetical protein